MRLPEHDVADRDAVVAAPEQIEHHARTVTGLADRVGQTWHAATVVGLDVAAYGQMCAFLPRILGPLQERLTKATRHAGEALEQTSAALGTVATTYAGTDADAAARLRLIGGGSSCEP